MRKKKYVWKMLYVYMLGYDVDFGYMELQAPCVKKAALCLLRLYRKNPDVVNVDGWEDRMAQLLDERDVGVLTSSVSLLVALVSNQHGDTSDNKSMEHDNVFHSISNAQSGMNPTCTPKSMFQIESSPFPTSISSHSNPKSQNSEAHQLSDDTTYTCDRNKNDQRNIDCAMHDSPSNGQNCGTSLYHDAENRNTSGVSKGTGSRSDGNTPQSVVGKNHLESYISNDHYDEPRGTNSYHTSQRESALLKFRLKRKDRCYDKKVRYESQKRQADKRPRMEGQFVRQVQSELVVLTGVTGSNLETIDVNENSVLVGKTTILFPPSFHNSLKLMPVYSPITVTVTKRINLASPDEGLIMGASFVVTASFYHVIETNSDDTDQSDMNAHLFQGLSSLHSMDQGLICSSNCDLETMTEAPYHYYYILQPSDNRPMLMRGQKKSNKLLITD
ncbi:hypothetical protein KIW84_075866 [Lathyrus oleraceus]|uniref:CCT domain-containing protein n=1 Tax=Pisum sativum TaxID=3888 RepID=A0A9D4VWB1_PEA|nr:hypothetical protein KIW84_075864 [Pisum sativum]KAI5390734.1 hypothetical protein KIW84_075866 [Pisum sativum]